MTDILHSMGSDLTLGNTGDVDVAVGDEATRERVMRRLLTNQGDYVWQLSYGGGLPGFIGKPVNAASIRATVQSQMLLEATVARQPLPTVTVTSLDGGFVVATITYASALTGLEQTSSIKLGAP